MFGTVGYTNVILLMMVSVPLQMVGMELTSGSASLNNMVIYPDEAFIVAKRTSGAVELNMEGVISTENQKFYLPQEGDQVVCNNPYNMDLYLAELIPSTAIGSGTGKFRPVLLMMVVLIM